MEFKIKVKCDACNGTGFKGHRTNTCMKCYGIGEIEKWVTIPEIITELKEHFQSKKSLERPSPLPYRKPSELLAYEKYKQSASNCKCKNWVRENTNVPELLHSKKCKKYNIEFELRYVLELYDEDW